MNVPDNQPNTPPASPPADLDPVVIRVDQPGPRLTLPKLPSLGPKATRWLMATAAGVILASIVAFGIFTYLANDRKFQLVHGLATPTPQASTGQSRSSQNLPGGGTAVGSGGTTGSNSPVVTLTSDPASVSVGGTAKLSWSVTNSPTSCTASDDWSGSKPASGSQTTVPRTSV